MPEDASQGQVLVDGGVPLVRVRTRRDAPAAEEYAAEELRRHLHAMAGAGPCLRNDDRSGARDSGPCLHVNDWDAAASAGIDTESMAPGPEAFHIASRADGVHLLGGGPRGVLYAVYELLERLGCRWLTPEISHIPVRRRIVLPPLDLTRSPAFEMRDMWIWEGRDPAWWVRNRMNGQYVPVPEYMGGRVDYGGFVHTFFGLVPPDEFFAEHPEYFSLIDGARKHQAAQLCLTNPDVLRIVIDRVRQRMRDNSQAGIFSVSQNDWEGYCQCPACAAVAEAEGGQSGPLLRFVNRVAEATAGEFPDRLIDTLAYIYTLDAPRHVRPHPNVRVRLCSIRCCQGHEYGTCDHPESARFLRALRDWHGVTDQMHVWHYCTNFANYPLAMPNFDEMHANLNLYRRSGVCGVFMQGMGEEGGGAEAMALRGYGLAAGGRVPRRGVRQGRPRRADLPGLVPSPRPRGPDDPPQPVRPAHASAVRRADRWAGGRCAGRGRVARARSAAHAGSPAPWGLGPRPPRPGCRHVPATR